MIIFNTNPLWTTILAFLILKDKLYKSELIGALLCFSAVVMITTGKEQADLGDVPYYLYQLGIAANLVSAVCFSFVTLLSRKMKDINFATILFWYSVIGCSAIGIIILVAGIIQANLMIFSYASDAYFMAVVGGVINSLA
jgi:drug/metabolite transporter (DMT)-like permease